MKKKEVWTKRVTSTVKEFQYDEKGNVTKVTETIIETQDREDEKNEVEGSKPE